MATLGSATKKHKVTIMGSGNWWGTTVSLEFWVLE